MDRTHSRNYFFLAALLTAALCLTTGASAIRRAREEPNGTLAGRLLVAAPEMGDPRFVETVIYIVKDDREGTLGLVINRPLAKGSLEDLLKGFGVESKDAKGEIIIHYGGPVGANQGFLLHSDEVLLKDSIKVKDGLAMTSDVEMLQSIGRGKGPKQYLFMVGYAGWAPGQLRGELEADAWYVIGVDKSFIFGKDAEHKWRQAIDKRQIPL
ncbi:MAG TPA: YqgE/AlgH family protein [Candidatus Binatia bacterium]|jgi:putative transcriptional regulator